MPEVKIKVNQLTRVEGHGNIHLEATDGKLDRVLWEVTESPRFFEWMLKGRNFDDVSTISSRICGICSIAHTTASLQATEAAFGIKLTEQAWLLRKLLYDAELLESHVLHVLFLIAPDFLGADSVIPLVATHGDVIVMAVRMKKLAYNLAEILAGRKTHPITPIVGGWSKLPDVDALKAVRERLVSALDDAETMVAVVKSLAPMIPNFNRPTEYIALKDSKEYAFITGKIASSDGGVYPLEDYQKITNEFCVPQSSAKYTKHARDSYMVGALSRFNLNSEQLLPRAKKAAASLGMKAPIHNPFFISVAQTVETVHCIEDAINIIDKLLARGLHQEEVKVKPRAGRGVGIVEAPRGMLIHDYTYNDAGEIVSANCIIPTGQNHLSIQKDFDELAPTILDKPVDEIRHTLEMLVRAYDPCISCSVH
ncbi:Coenzyme F420-reducing hydrogenase, alpha subunit [Dehalogenimonas formicexedens]|uniref:Coenzyme F420-reducing hydrogenase, alpha subunit n=1 Tax=Dehalogenimonas formicexedens TaxID=1839801 RepID=A0A1P8F642_9CHLR|nr:Ni/Fe hydrogenase subunit alpha [Dehalogenimonas formicexedens]APV43957.1 Coenzyme F420-reducing hydrogenase, alpha subunit [Dehalogenimonas formicexedens]